MDDMKPVQVELANSLVSLTPMEWSALQLNVSFFREDNGHPNMVLEVTSPEGHREPAVSIPVEMFPVIQRLWDLARRQGQPWYRMAIMVYFDEQWKYDMEFELEPESSS